jgi:methyl-accepting chemotaxis protein
MTPDRARAREVAVMKWSFRRKLLLALLLFSLVPTSIATLVTLEASGKLTDRTAHVLRRAAVLGATGLSQSPLEEAKKLPVPVLDRSGMQSVNAFFDNMLQEYQYPMRVVLVAPDLTVLTVRSRGESRDYQAPGDRLGNPYAELVRPYLSGSITAAEERAHPYFEVSDGASGAEILGISAVNMRTSEQSTPVPHAVIAISMRGNVFQAIDMIRYQSLAVLAACVVAAVILGLVLSDLFVRPLTQIVEVAHHLEQGDLRVRAGVVRSDELGQLSSRVDSVIARLSDVIREISQATSSVSMASNELSASAQELSQGATEQASTLEQIATGLQTVDASVKSNAQNARQTAKTGQDARTQAEEGGKAVQETVAAMKQIAQRIKVVEDIAYQTNLLALNAAIEAARAGTQGKGFAVVAGEVRKLAERSQTAAHQIGELASSSVEVAENAGRLLDQIVPAIRTTSGLIQEIAAASQEQTTAIHEIHVGVRQLEEVVQQNAAASHQLASTASSLAGQSGSLEHLMGFFHLNADESAHAPGVSVARAEPPRRPPQARVAPALSLRRLPGTPPAHHPVADSPRGERTDGVTSGTDTHGGIVVNLDETDADFERLT